jgi:hypothetical protein
MTVHCAKCATPFSAAAKFCPHCGEAAPTSARATTSPPPPHASIDFGKMNAPVPPAGVAFLAALVLAPTFIIFGIVVGLKLLIFIGIAICILLAVVLVLGHFF